MKTVAKLIKGVRVIMGLCKLINTSISANYAENSSQYTVLARPSVRPSVRPSEISFGYLLYN